MRFPKLLVGLALAAVTTGVAAQLLPPLPRAGDLLGGVGRLGERTTGFALQTAERLATARIDRLAALVRAHPAEIEFDPAGAPARASEVVIGEPSPEMLAAATARGYRVIEQESLLGAEYARLRVPPNRSLRAAIRELRQLGAADVSADQLHLASGTANRMLPPPVSGAGPRVGIIDGGLGSGAAVQRGFASGAPRPSDHAAAVASLIVGGGAVRGAAPGASLYVADVYGADPAGGNAVAIAKALAWLVGERVPVVTISLVGPANPLLARVVAAAQARGTIIVAPVGNDGPAAPPAYPASYAGVIAVTGVDARNRVLIEAGRASHLDYAAPAADMLAANREGRPAPVRGTSFAAPLVAGLIARAYPAPGVRPRAAVLAATDRQAVRAGPRYGRGILCSACPARIRSRN